MQKQSNDCFATKIGNDSQSQDWVFLIEMSGKYVFKIEANLLGGERIWPYLNSLKLTHVEQRLLEKTGEKMCKTLHFWPNRPSLIWRDSVIWPNRPSPFSTLSTIGSVGTPLTWFKLQKRTLDANDAYS